MINATVGLLTTSARSTLTPIIRYNPVNPARAHSL